MMEVLHASIAVYVILTSETICKPQTVISVKSFLEFETVIIG